MAKDMPETNGEKIDIEKLLKENEALKKQVEENRLQKEEEKTTPVKIKRRVKEAVHNSRLPKIRKVSKKDSKSKEKKDRLLQSLKKKKIVKKTIVENYLEEFSKLSPESQKEALDFIKFLRKK